MSEEEKLAAAEEFVRKAVSTLSMPVEEEAIKSAARKAAKSLPPYGRPDSRRKRAVRA
jgi:hypothetical protein